MRVRDCPHLSYLEGFGEVGGGCLFTQMALLPCNKTKIVASSYELVKCTICFKRSKATVCG